MIEDRYCRAVISDEHSTWQQQKGRAKEDGFDRRTQWSQCGIIHIIQLFETGTQLSSFVEICPPDRALVVHLPAASPALPQHPLNTVRQYGARALAGETNVERRMTAETFRDGAKV